MARTVASADPVDLSALLDFVRPRHRMVLTTFRADEGVQTSPVSGGVDTAGRLVIASYPRRAKVTNARRRSSVSVCVLSDDWNGPYVQVDGTAEVLDMPEAEDALVDYFRSISGEHSDWDEYRAAMRLQNKSLIRVTPTRWGPIASGGFPADVARRLDAAEA